LFGVIYDANVLVPASLTDTLVRTASSGLCTAHWSQDILDEVYRTLRRRGMDESKARRRIAVMAAIPSVTMVSGYEDLIPVMKCDEKDRHVQAAAVCAKLEAIITYNLKDFPTAALQPYDLRAISPDEFLHDCLKIDATVMSSLIDAQAKALHAPTMTAEDVLERLSHHVPTFTKALRSFRAKHAIVPFPGAMVEDATPKASTIRRRTRRAPRDIS
jgi:predicted nucleic acid-binding protein